MHARMVHSGNPVLQQYHCLMSCDSYISVLLTSKGGCRQPQLHASRHILTWTDLCHMRREDGCTVLDTRKASGVTHADVQVLHQNPSPIHSSKDQAHNILGGYQNGTLKDGIGSPLCALPVARTPHPKTHTHTKVLV